MAPNAHPANPYEIRQSQPRLSYGKKNSSGIQDWLPFPEPPSAEHGGRVPVFLKAGSIRNDEPYLRMLSIGDRHSRLLLQIYRGACQEIALPSGIYRINAWHDATLVKGKPVIAFLQPAAPDVPLLDANQNPRPGFWAIRPDPAPSTPPATNAKAVSQLILLKSASAQPENPPSAYGHPLHNLNTATFSRRRNAVPDQQSQTRC